MRSLVIITAVVVVVAAAAAAGCAGAEGEGEGEGEGDAALVLVGDGGADLDHAVDVDGSTLPMRFFGNVDGGGAHAGLHGMYRVTGLGQGTSLLVSMEDFAETFGGCSPDAQISVTGIASASLAGDVDENCPTTDVSADASGEVYVFWDGDPIEDFGIRVDPAS